jgi:hypothetical protein
MEAGQGRLVLAANAGLKMLPNLRARGSGK